LTGNLGNDPEIHYSQDGSPIASFNLAFHTSSKKEEPNWIRCISFGKLAETVDKYLHKGARIAIVGTLDQNRWVSNEGVQKSNFQILLNTVEFIKINGRDPEHGQTSDDNLPF
jgi:single-strand DNA-binding protein